jgi:predicted amidophosphoribosyltransferase
MLADGLARTTQRGTQVDARGAAARQANVRAAFVGHDGVAGLRIVLVDDVTTTGATLDAAAGALKRAGAIEVHGLTFAREA